VTRQPNPNDPSLVDVYDDDGNYLTTLPAETGAIQTALNGPEPTQAPAAPSTGLGITSVGQVGAVLPEAPKAPGPVVGDAKQAIGNALASQGAPELAPPKPASLVPGSADEMPSPEEADGLIRMEPGAADQQAYFPGTEGGWMPTQAQSSGINPGAVGRYQQEIEGLAGQEQAAALDEALAREIQLEQDEKRQLELEREVKEAQAKHAIEQKQIFERRATVEQKIADVANQEPDRNRAFPTGFNAVATFIGAIAGGMLQGLNGGGSNPTQSEQLKDLTRQLGSIDAAESMLRAKQKEIVLKETEARLLGSQNKVAPAQIDAFRKRMNAEISRHRIDALTKLERDLTIQEANVPGSAATPVDAESYRARSLQQYATENAIPVKDAHKQWVAYNKEFKERATLRAGLDTAERLIQKYEETGDVAGLGPLAKFIPSSVNSQDAKAVRQVLGSVTAQYLKQISGAAVTEQEYARTIENLQGPGDFDSVKRGLGLLRQSITSADEESQVENPGFSRLRRELRDMTRSGAVRGAPGRAQQEAAVGSPVTIPRTSRIAYEHKNPGNLTFAGQAGATRGEPKAGGGYWAKFEDEAAGMRALARQVQLDQQRGLNVRQFVEKYAPSTDGNNVDKYLAKLQRLTGADEATQLSEMSAGNLAFAIAYIESETRPNK
jgi:hypothetical protein